MVNNILISVIMPAFNAELYIEEAVKSILNQTYINFELIIIDDCSIDDTYLKIKKFDDPRIVLLQNDCNRGIVYCLNKAISIANGSFIARMDADDISHRNRLEYQFNCFMLNDRLVLCGSHYSVLYRDRVIRQVFLPVLDEDIKKRMLFHNPICHPSVMFKRILWDYVKYKEENVGCEDYALWLDSSDSGEYYNIPLPLLFYRVHSDNISLKSNSFRDSRLFIHLKFNVQKFLGHEIKGSKLTLDDIAIIIKSIKYDKLYLEAFIEYLIIHDLIEYRIFFNCGLHLLLTYLKIFFKLKINNVEYRLNIFFIERNSLFN